MSPGPVVVSTGFPQAQEVLDQARVLLNDADIPIVSNIVPAPTGAVRVGNLATITTAAAHGLAPGDRVTIEGVGNTSFNGTFTVKDVPTTTTFTYDLIAADTTSGQGTVSLIIQGDVFTNAVLLPLLNRAYRAVQRKLLRTDSPTTISEVDFLSVPVGTLTISDVSTPQLPVDFLAPRGLWERPAGSANKYVPMHEADQIPDAPQTTALGFYAWREDALFFIGASALVDIRLRYSRTLGPLTAPDSQILIRNSVDPIASYTAFLAAASRGAVGASYLLELFREDMVEFLAIQVHAKQGRPARRRAYGGKRRGFYRGGAVW